MSTKTIVLIHGLFVNPASWAGWKACFENAGYTCHTPAYPFHEGTPASRWESVDPGLARLDLKTVTAHLQQFIDQLPEKPILIGHSMGGLLTQILINEGRGVAGVCIDSAPPQGIFTAAWSFLRWNLPVINPLAGNSVFYPTVEWFHGAFCNTMSLTETRQEFDQFVVPESRNIPLSSTMSAGKVDFRKPHAPLLFIAGERDTIVPASLNRRNFNAYRDTNSRREFKEFPGRSHYICGQPGWEEVTGFVLEWVRGCEVSKLVSK